MKPVADAPGPRPFTGPGAKREDAGAASPSRLANVAVVAGGLLVTAALSALAAHGHARPVIGASLAAALLLALWHLRHRIASLRLRGILAAIVMLMPLAALLGPALAVPGLRSFYLYRLLVAALLALGAAWALLTNPRWRLAAPGLLELYALWVAWLCVTMIWAPDKTRALTYLASFLLIGILAVATASAGVSHRRFRFLLISVAVGYALMVLVAAGESLTGRHLPTSGLAGGDRTASAFFFNPNDLGTFLAMCWPFLLLGLFSTRRRAVITLDVLAMAISAWVLVDTGSRSALLAIALETLAAAAFVAFRRGVGARITVVVIVVAIMGGIAYLGLSGSTSKLNVVNLVRQQQAGQGSGATRLQLQVAGLRAAATRSFLGVGPGNAEPIVQAQNPDLSIINLHDWWLEVFVDGGFPAFLLYLVLYGYLLQALTKVALRGDGALIRYSAAASALALVGFVIGSFGPSTMINFLPLGLLFGVGVAVLIRENSARREAGGAACH
jgi:teichuronic acid biosynthesis protein TuaE